MTQSAARLTPKLDLVFDAELQQIIDIAAHVGHVSGDEVNVSYTSLMIGLLWSDDNKTSKWLQSKITELGASVEGIYQSRSGITHRNREDILKNVKAGVKAPPRPDYFSVSARTVLQEAASIAVETGRTPQDPLGARHLAAAYFLRNPPGHDPQLQDDWRFDLEKWRRAFAAFLGSNYKDELQNWSQVLIGYLAVEGFDGTIPGHVLGTYVFDQEALKILRQVEEKIRATTPAVFTSMALLQTLASSGTIRDSRLFAEIAAKALKISDTIDLSQEATPFDSSGSPQAASRGFKNILDRSRLLTRSITDTDTIGVRHLIASILVRLDSTGNEKLAEAGVDIPLLRRKLYLDFTRNWLTDDGVQWNFHLVGRAPTSIAGYSSDRAEGGDDALDVTRYASAFAAVLSAEAVLPPISIGIFGDWGSGKSFFMRLMREQTTRVSALPDVDAEGKRLFCQNVVSIEFNAWHYSEENLLASLVQTILVGLRKALVGGDEESEFMDEVVAKLEIAQLARKDAEQRVKAAREELSRRDSDLKTARENAQKEIGNLNTVKTKDAIQIVRQTVFPDTSKSMAKAISLAETYLGIEGLQEFTNQQQKTFGTAADLLDQIGLTSRRVQSTGQWLLRAPLKWEELQTPALIVGLLVPVGGAGIYFLKDSVGVVWPAICAAAGQFGVIVKFAHGFAQRHLTKINTGLDAADKIRSDIDKQLAAEKKKIEDEVLTAQKARDDAQGKVENLEAELKAKQADLKQAEKDLEESKSERRIARLVQQRLEAKDYEKYLGIVAAIRHDFETLSKLMQQMRAEPRVTSEAIQPIDRIVLYIDDLDRCPTNKVVSVLEAIHLFLAFELFVVVVGVDVRWAARSLEEKYPYHLSSSDGASALDYLEKIFQIPFWLPPMQTLASQNMIADLVPVMRTNGAQNIPQATNNTSVAANPNPQGTSTNQTPTAVPKTPEAGKTEVLHLDPEERLFMLSLAGAVGKSPRRLKRFVNTYRILKGSIDALEREKFVVDGGKRGEYRSAMVLLAMVTGAPQTAMGIFEQLCDPNDSTSFEQLTEKPRKDLADGLYITAACEVFKAAGLKVEELRNWAPQISRFSFRAGRV